MHRPRHRPLLSARLYFSLLSALALAAFACLPALAQAECTDSSCAQYEVEIPTPGGKDAKKDGKSGNHDEPSAGASTESGGNDGEPQAGNEGSEEGEEDKAGAAAGKNGDGPSDKNGSPAAGNPTADKGDAGLKDSVAVPPATESGEQASNSSGGSSPLVPILIAIAVLAAISIGAVIYRQRRQGSGGSGSPVSPNA